MSDDQELIPIEQQTEDGEHLPQAGLEEAEATSERALVPLQVSQVVVTTTTAGPGQRVFAAAASGDLLAAGSPAWLAV